MTATITAPGELATWSVGAPRLLAGLDHHATLDLDLHRAVHGATPPTDLNHLLAQLDGVRLTGRGGAGFPLAAKLRALPTGRAQSVIVNGTESEPGSLKDRVLLRRTPHLVLDGALAVATSTGARSVTVAVHDKPTADAVERAARDRRDGPRVRVLRIPDGFVRGEARAVVRAAQGGPALPPGRLVHATERGVLLANAETFAQVAMLLRLGWRRFAETGAHVEPGTMLLTVGGAVGQPGVVEVPTGTPLDIVLTAAHAATPQAVVLGGYHGSWHLPSEHLPLSRSAITAAGGSLGAGVVLVLDHATCALGELATVTRWLADQSANQCGPCRFGLPTLATDVESIYRGVPAAHASAMRHADVVDGRGACRHPDGTVAFVRSGLRALSDELDAHLNRGGCGRPVLHRLPLGGAS